MSYKWKPSASQRKAFAIRMQDPQEEAAYNERKQAKKAKFYNSLDAPGAGSNFVPTKEQHDFAMFRRPEGMTPEQTDACNMVSYGFTCNEAIDHYYIHLVNEMRRNRNKITS